MTEDSREEVVLTSITTKPIEKWHSCSLNLTLRVTQIFLSELKHFYPLWIKLYPTKTHLAEWKLNTLRKWKEAHPNTFSVA